MKLVGIVITAIICITILAVAAIATGHDTHLVTGTTAAISAIVTGCIAYYKGKSKAAKERTNGNKETDSSG